MSKRPTTVKQAAQRELAWCLYITMGYTANISHAATVNAYTMAPEILSVIKKAQEDAQKTEQRIIRAMRSLT